MKYLPADEKIEAYILGCCANAFDVDPELKEEYFHYEKHQRIFKAFKDGVFFPSETTQTKYGIKDDSFFEVLESSASSNYTKKNFDTLLELYGRRELIIRSHESIKKANDLTLDPKELDLGICQDEYIIEGEKLSNQIVEGWRKMKSLKSGFNPIDMAIGAFDIEDVWYLAGRSGTKKTSLGIQLLENICEKERCNGIFFSIEMGKFQFFKRMGMMLYYKLNSGIWQTGDYQRARYQCSKWFLENRNIELANAITPKNYSICWKTGLTINDITLFVRSERKKGKNVKVILIDYLQLMKDPTKSNRRDEVSAIARDLKSVAKREGIKIIALSQLTRAGGEDGTVRPRLHDLKESGDIEESADIVTGNWKGSDESYINMITLKNRNDGIGGEFILMTDGVYFRDPLDQELSMITGN